MCFFLASTWGYNLLKVVWSAGASAWNAVWNGIETNPLTNLLPPKTAQIHPVAGSTRAPASWLWQMSGRRLRIFDKGKHAWLKTIGSAIAVCWPHVLQRVKWTFAGVGRSSTWELAPLVERNYAARHHYSGEQCTAERSEVITLEWQKWLWYTVNTVQQWTLCNSRMTHSVWICRQLDNRQWCSAGYTRVNNVYPVIFQTALCMPTSQSSLTVWCVLHRMATALPSLCCLYLACTHCLRWLDWGEIGSGRLERVMPGNGWD